jgi:hypothetical protein
VNSGCLCRGVGTDTRTSLVRSQSRLCMMVQRIYNGSFFSVGILLVLLLDRLHKLVQLADLLVCDD